MPPKTPKTILKKPAIQAELTRDDIAIIAGNIEAPPPPPEPLRVDPLQAVGPIATTTLNAQVAPTLSDGAKQAFNEAFGIGKGAPTPPSTPAPVSPGVDRKSVAFAAPVAAPARSPGNNALLAPAKTATSSSTPAKASAPKDATSPKPQARTISIRMIEAYLREFRSECAKVIPMNWERLSDEDLQKITEECDTALGQGAEYDTLALAIPATLMAYEQHVMPRLALTNTYRHAYGVGQRSKKELETPGSKLDHATRRLAIKFTGYLDKGPYMEFVMAMAAVIHTQACENIDAGRIPTDIARAIQDEVDGDSDEKAQEFWDARTEAGGL